MSLFTNVEMAPRDPILGLNEQFGSDPNPDKVNLGVGVYYDENGKLPLLKCVSAAEQAMAEAAKPRGYLPIDGIAAYDAAVQSLVFGADSDVVKSRRVATVQAIGGTGGLKVGADFLKQVNGEAQVLISAPSWENHRALFTRAGFDVAEYPYYDAKTRGIDFDAMRNALQMAPAGTIVVLHACCHNPTGVDLMPAQWDEVIAIVKANNLVPFLDMAYQGFGQGIAEDGAAVAKFVASGVDLFVATSFSKSFSLYGERVGALSVERRRSLARVVAVEDRHPHQLLQPTDAWRADRRHRAGHAGPARAVGGRTGRHAGAHQGHAQRVGGKARRSRRQAGHGLHRPPARHVQLLGPERRANAAPAQRIRCLRRRFGPHLRGRAECREHRRRGRRHRESGVSQAKATRQKRGFCRCFCAG